MPPSGGNNCYNLPMQKSLIPIILVALMFLTGCATETIPEDEPLDIEEIREIDEPEPAEGPAKLEERSGEPQPELEGILGELESYLDLWAEVWQEYLPGFSPHNLVEGDTNPIHIQFSGSVDDYGPDPSWQEDYDYPIFIFGPSDTKFLYVSPEGEPDSDVAIINLKDNSYKKVLGCGTPCNYDGAVWLDDNKFVVTGHSEYYPPDDPMRCTVGNICTVIPIVWFFDLTKNTVTEYLGPEYEIENHFVGISR